MARIIRQSTQITEMIGPFLDKDDGVTEEAGLAGGGTEISKNGAAYGAGPTLGTYDSEGWYPITLTTSHTDTVGSLKIKSQAAATHLPVWLELQVVEEAVYDAFFAASAPGYVDGATVDVTKISGDATAADNLEAACDGTTYNIGGGAIVAASVTGAVGSVAGLTASDVGAIKTKTDYLPSATAGAAGGVFIAGTNAATTITSAGGTALTLSSSGGNGAGLAVSGNGSGHGIVSTGGATGDGMRLLGGGTSGDGLHCAAQTSGEGMDLVGAGNGHGILATGSGSGEGLHATAGGGANGHGAHFEGVGANSHGLLVSRGGAGGDDLKFANNDCTVPNVTLVDTTTTNTDMRGTDNAALAATALSTANWTTARAGYLDELAAVNLPADIDQIKGDLPSRITKNAALAAYPFVMTDSTNHVPTASLTVTAQRRIDGGAFAACANAVSEVSNGVYTIDLAASDLNGDTIILRFTASGADDLLITIVTQP